MPPRTASRKLDSAPAHAELDEAEVVVVQREPRRFSRGRLSRGRGLRKTTGCLTCRRRHVRCDEVKPACGGCARRQADCVYLAPRQSLDPIPDSSSSSSTVRATRSSRALSSADTSSVQVGTTTSSHDVSTSGTIPSPTPAPPSSSQLPSLSAEEYSASSCPAVELQPPEITSEKSCLTASESPTAQWLGLLLEDALRQEGFIPGIQQFETEGFDIFGNSRAQSPAAAPRTALPSDGTKSSRTLVTDCYQTPASRFGDSLLGTSPGRLEASLAAPSRSMISTAPEGSPQITTHNSSLQERIPRLGRHQLSERQVWHSLEVIELLPREQVIFRHFVQTISQWVRQLQRYIQDLGAFHTTRRVYIQNVLKLISLLIASCRWISSIPASHSEPLFLTWHCTMSA